MKETKIGKENVENLNTSPTITIREYSKFVIKTHKQTCERWLEEDKKELKYLINLVKYIRGNHFLRFIDRKQERVNDRKQAIKLYEENGI